MLPTSGHGQEETVVGNATDFPFSCCMLLISSVSVVGEYVSISLCMPGVF